MHAVELLDLAIAAVKKLGYRVRVEVLDGDTAAGVCEFGGRRWLFLDGTQGPLEQLHQVLEVLRAAAQTGRLQLAEPLERLVHPRRAA